MPITLITGPANAGKAELVLDAVRMYGARELDPLLVVPTRADAELYLRELAGDGVTMGVRVERFDGLTAEVVQRAGVDEAVLGGIARERLLHWLSDRELVAGAGDGFVRALSELVVELRTRRVSPARLVAALDSWQTADGAGATGAVLGRLFMRYEAELRRMARADGEQCAVRALDALRERPSLWGGRPVLFYGFDDLSRMQLDTIETLGVVVDAPVTVSLAYEAERSAFAGRAATFQALAPLAAEHRRLSARAEHYAPASRTALSHLERSLFEPGAARVSSGGAVALLEGGGERAELELVAREISLLLAQGTAAEEVAVLARPSGTSLELLAEVFTAAGVPFALQRRVLFADTALGRALIGLLRCVGAPATERGGDVGDAPGELADLLAWLRAPGQLELPALADRLERQARRSGALSADAARAQWQRHNWPLETIDRLQEAQARGAAALIELAARELQRLFSAPRRRAAELLSAEALDEARALAEGGRALAQLRELARLAPELAPATAAELARVLGTVELFSGDHPAPGAVAVLDPLALRARRVRALFVCGLQEGVFPARARVQPLLSERERRRLAEVSGLRLGEQVDLLAAERYLLYAAVSRPEERLVLSWHSADDEGQTTPRSLFVDDVCDLFEQSLFTSRARRALGAVDSPAVPAGPIRASEGSGEAGGASDGAGESARSERPDEPLCDARLLEELAARPWSASAMERWIGCPVAWFVQRVLRPDELDPEAEPLVQGSLRHTALERTLLRLREETGSARLTRANLARARELLAEALQEGEVGKPLSVSPERRVTVRRRLQADLDRYLAREADGEAPLEPRELELGFGVVEGDDRGEPSELPAFELGGGVKLRGRIDRLDVGEHGEAVVYDYKGGKVPLGASKWIEDGKLQVALYMSAVEQLLGVRVVGGFYQPLTGNDLRPRGVLDGDSGIELDCVSTDVREHDEVREVLDRALSAAREVASEAAAGRLQARPDTCAFRGGCAFPTICRCER